MISLQAAHPAQDGTAAREEVRAGICQHSTDNRHYGVAETESLIREAIALDNSRVDTGPGV
jgi:hypothetical protein